MTMEEKYPPGALLTFRDMDVMRDADGVRRGTVNGPPLFGALNHSDKQAWWVPVYTDDHQVIYVREANVLSVVPPQRW